MRRFSNILFIAFALCLGALSGCNDPEEDELAGSASIELLNRLVAVEAEGGEQMVGFVLTNGKSSQLSGRCADDWCHSFAFPEEGVMTFVVEPNMGTSSRITNVYIACGKTEEKFSLSQSGAGSSPDALAKMNFDIQYDINGPEVTMTVVPEYDNVRYYFAYSTKAELDAIGADKVQGVIKANVQSFLQGEVNALVNYAGYSVTDALNEYTGFGTRSASMTINARTDYVGWACAVSNDITVISDVVMKEFTTGDVAPSSNNITITIDQVNCDRVSFSIATTNEDQYAVYVMPAEQVEGLSDDEIVALFNTSEDVTYYLNFGDYSSTRVGLEADKDYYLFAYGYKWGMANTPIHRAKFHTLTYQPGQAEFTIDVQRVYNIGFAGTIMCEPNTHLYYYDYCDVDTTTEELLAAIEEAVDWAVNQAGYYPNRLSLMRAMGSRGTTDFAYSSTFILPNNDYRVYAIAVDEVTGEFCAEPYFSPIITTPDVSDVMVELEFGQYFDAAEVAMAYPESGYDVAEVSGYALVPISVTASDDVAAYYLDVFLDDLSDTSYPTDDQLFEMLYVYGIRNRTPVFALCSFYEELKTPVTITSVAIGTDGNRGKVDRNVVTITRSGCADVSEYAKYLIPSNVAARCVAKEQSQVVEPKSVFETLINRYFYE